MTGCIWMQGNPWSDGTVCTWRDIGHDRVWLTRCLFGAGQRKEPEVYPRPDGTVYICGESDSSAVPDDPLSITPRADAMTALQVCTPYSQGLLIFEVQEATVVS